MKKNLRLVMLVIVIVIIIVIAILAIKLNKENSKISSRDKYSITYTDGTKKNTSSSLKKDKKFNEYEISNIELSYRDGVSTILGDIKNTSNSKTEETNIAIDIIDKNKNKLLTLSFKIKALEAGEITELNVAVIDDITNSYDFQVRKQE